MFKLLDKCIFCDSKLPEAIKGEGEHVIPKNIYGFWHVYDVCEKCKEYFGDNIDQLSVHEPLILQAMKILNLPDFDNYISNVPFKAYNVESGEEKEVIYKNGELRIRVQKESDKFMQCPSELSDKIVKNWIHKNIENDLSKEELDNEFAEFKKPVKPGEKILSKKLGYEMTKSQYHNPEINLNALKNITPLIAKICGIFLRYILSNEQINSLSNYNNLIQHARYNSELSGCIIQFHPIFFDDSYDKVHVLRSSSTDKGIFIDIAFFTYINYRVFVPSDSLVIFKSITGVLSDSIIMAFNFCDANDKIKEYCFRPKDSKEYERYILKG